MQQDLYVSALITRLMMCQARAKFQRMPFSNAKECKRPPARQVIMATKMVHRGITIGVELSFMAKEDAST